MYDINTEVESWKYAETTTTNQTEEHEKTWKQKCSSWEEALPSQTEHNDERRNYENEEDIKNDTRRTNEEMQDWMDLMQITGIYWLMWIFVVLSITWL